jgi:hypothetical protein
MQYTLYARDTNEDFGGEADVASVRARKGDDLFYVGCCSGEVDASPCLWQVFTDDPVAEMASLGVEPVQEQL